MLPIKLTTRRGLLLVALALLASGCSSPEAQKQRHFDQGNKYSAEKRDDFAVIEYANAVRIDPKFGEAVEAGRDPGADGKCSGSIS